MENSLYMKATVNMFEALEDEPKEILPPRVSPPPLMENVAFNIAAEKLRRQTERISQNDAVLDDLVKKGRGGRSSKWKPFDLRECFEGDASDNYDENRHTPLDVHAKPFLPEPPLTVSSEDGVYGDYNQFEDYIKHARAQNDDFQLITGTRRLRTTGLNAYQVREENRTPTVTASYNKREINNVFGNDLPSPSYCQSHPGTENGQIQFCIHPNGDVSAQQWFLTQHQWINVGQYSNIRKRTEGQLASDRLRGETEGQSLQQNTLAYFHAIAKQREASVIGRPFGIKEIQACLPASDMSYAAHSESVISSGSARPAVAVPIPKPSHGQERVKTALELITSRDTPTPLARTQRFTRSANADPGADNRYGNLIFGSMSCVIESAQEGESRSGGDVAITPLTSHNLPLLYGSRYRSPDTNRSHDNMYQSVMSVPSASRDDPTRAGAGRGALHDILQQLSVSDSSRSSGTVGRTVMHDPVSQSGTSVLSGARLENPFGGPPADALYDLVHRHQDSPTANRNYTRSSTTRGLDLKESEPEATRGAELLLSRQGKPPGLSSEVLQLGDPPTVQCLDEGFLWDPNREYTQDESHDAELRNWFFSGNKAERHDDFFQRILQYHSATEVRRPSHARDPGVIGPPSRAQTAAAPREVARSFNEGVTRLLIPVMENLASYVEGPEHQRHGWCAPFTAPPEWAVDKSPSGNNSFFDGDWGKPPERIGRDQRYRSVGMGGGARKPSFNANEGWSPVRGPRY